MILSSCYNLVPKCTLLSKQNEMKRFLVKIVNLMKDENLFASQGGPIILAQVAYSYLFKSFIVMGNVLVF